MPRDVLNREGFEVGRKHVATLMVRMGIEAMYRRPGTSKKHPGHTIYPYLLRHLAIERANQGWALDTTYIPMARGFVYLTAVIDWASRKVLAHRVAITLAACHAVEVLTEAFTRYGAPDIVNTDQGSQFTAAEFIDLVKGRGCQVSMDGRGAWRDNVFVERRWRTVKYQESYLHAYDTVVEAKAGIAKHLDGYNRARPHSSLKSLPGMLRSPRTPHEAYLMLSPACSLAA